MSGALIVGGLVGLAAMLGFVAVWQMLGARDPVAARLEEFTLADKGGPAIDVAGQMTLREQASSRMMRLLKRFNLGPKLTLMLARAGVSMTAGEFGAQIEALQ
jgi:hypothetical protein